MAQLRDWLHFFIHLNLPYSRLIYIFVYNMLFLLKKRSWSNWALQRNKTKLTVAVSAWVARTYGLT